MYLGSAIKISAGTNQDVSSKNGKARSAFNILAGEGGEVEILEDSKSCINEKCMKTVVFCGSERWRMTEKIVSKLQTFKYMSAQNPS